MIFNYTTYIILGLILFLNIALFFISKAVIKYYKKNELHNEIAKLVSKFVFAISIFLSFIAVVGISDYRLSKVLDYEIFVIGNKIDINIFLVGFIAFSLWFFYFTNRFIIRLFRLAKNKIDIPKNMSIIIRRWLLITLFLFLIAGVVKFTNRSFDFFSIILFSIQSVNITVSKIINAIYTFYTVHMIITCIEYFFNIQLKKKRIDESKGHSIFQIARYFIWVFTFVFILGNLGLKVSIILAGSAALFVGIGFGLQSLFNDFISGLIILFEGTISINDVVELENGVVGRIKEIGLRASKVVSVDNIINIVPNNNFVNKNVINWSYNENKTRFKVKVGVAYGSDVRLVEKLLIECALEHDKIYRIPQPYVIFENFGASSLDFKLFFWIDDTFRYEKVCSDIRFSINDKFAKNNIQIPFPQRDIHFKSKSY